MVALHGDEEIGDLDTLPAVIAARAVTDRDQPFVQALSAGTELTFGEFHDAGLTWADAL